MRSRIVSSFSNLSKKKLTFSKSDHNWDWTRIVFNVNFSSFVDQNSYDFFVPWNERKGFIWRTQDLFKKLSKTNRKKMHKKLPHSVAIWRGVSPNWLTWFTSAPKWMRTFTLFWFPERAASWRGVFPWMFTTLTLAPFAIRNPTALTWPKNIHRGCFERQKFETILSIFQTHFQIPEDKQIFIQNWSHPGCRRAVKKKEKLSYRF